MSKTTLGELEVGDEFEYDWSNDYRYQAIALSDTEIVERLINDEDGLWTIETIMPDQEVTLIKRSCQCKS